MPPNGCLVQGGAGLLASAFAVLVPFFRWLKLPSEKASSAESVGYFRLGQGVNIAIAMPRG